MSMKVRALLASSLLLATLSTVGCGHYVCGTTFGSATCTPSGGGLNQGGNGNNIGVTAFVYFVDDNAGQIAAEGLNVSNSENFAPVANFVPPSWTQGLVDYGIVTVKKKFLYVLLGDGTVRGYGIDPASGALSSLTGSPFSPAVGTTMVADPTGKFLFVGDSTGISVFTIDATSGALTANPSNPFSTGSVTPLQLATDGVGRYLYSVEGSSISAWSFDGTTGALTAVTGSPFSGAGFGMAQIVGESSGKYLLGITAETGAGSGATDKNIYVFSITQPGVATAGAISAFGTPVAGTYTPGYLAVSPNGKFVYTFNQNSAGTSSSNDPMEGFSFSAGVLTELTTSPFTGLDAQLGRFDQSGAWLFSIANVPNSSFSGEFAYGLNTTNGTLSSTLSHAGVPSASFAVTDEP